MTDKRISQLDAITGANTASDDVFIVTDTSTGESKKITRAELNNAMELDPIADIEVTGGTIDGTVIGGTTTAAGSFTTVTASGAITGDLTGDVTGDVTGNIDAATGDFSSYIDLTNTSSPTHSEGRIFYDSTNGALAVYNDESDITLQVGQEEYIRVKNTTGATITNGTPVYLTGEDANIPTIAKATANTEVGSYAVGLATHDIENNTTGYVTTRGLVQDLDTSALTEGERIHVAVTAGTLQTAAPTYPYFTTDIGICLISNASTGCIYVDVQPHTLEVLRVTDNAHVDGNLVIDGDLTVNGTQTVADSASINVGAPFNYLNAGDTIGESGTTHSGTGLDDATLVGHFSGTASTTYYVRIDGTGTPDTFEWSKDNFSTTEATGVSITGADQTLDNGIEVRFNATTGHTSGDSWSGTAAPADVDTGLFTNRNTGGSGIGYTHLGFFYDVSANEWVLLNEYDPEPTGTIDLSDSSVVYGDLKMRDLEAEDIVSDTLTIDTDTLVVDATNDRVGINVASPDEALEVSGTAKATTLALDNTAGDWTFEVSSNNLIIKYGGTAKAKLDTSGNLVVVGNVTAYGTI